MNVKLQWIICSVFALRETVDDDDVEVLYSAISMLPCSMHLQKLRDFCPKRYVSPSLKV